MRVAVVGAGIAGLVAARDLTGAGHDVVVIEKSRGLGGRMAARRLEGTVLDHGLPVLEVPSAGVLAALIDDLAPGAVRLDGDAVAWPMGMTVLPKAMAGDASAAGSLEMVLDTRVAALRAGDEGIEVAQDQGNTIGVFDAVVITAPAPQTVDLLVHSPEPLRADALRAVEYDPAVMVLAGFAIDEPGWVAARPDAGPVAYVTNETVKGRPPVEGVVPVVARLRPDASERLFDASDATVCADAVPAIRTVLGPGTPEPSWTQVKRWRYCVARTRLNQEVLNPEGSRIIVAGDAVAPGPTVEDVAQTGQWAARRLITG
jgi:predicted NAD/FAD-dependent oxidoreductase